MKNTLLLFLLLFSLSTFGQKKEVINGKEYIVHEVVKGNTLYSISKQYNISLSDVLNNNPEAEKGIAIGQKLYIPTETEVNEPKANNSILDGKAFDDSVKLKKYHIVAKQETLYSIARMYNTTLNDIVKLNPGIEEGIQIGQRIIIPDEVNKTNTSTSTNIIYYDTVIPHVVLKQETLYSISKRYIVPQKDIVAYNKIKNNTINPGTTIYIPLKKDEFKPIEIRDIPKLRIEERDELTKNEFVFKKKDSYKVVIALPFGLSNKDEKYRDVATEFYMGAEYALDSLQKSGLTADVFVIDCSGDTTAFKKKLAIHEDADIMIGPFLGSSMDAAAGFCKKNGIKIVNPLLGYTKPLQGNEFVANAMTSDITLMEGLATYLSKKEDAGKILLVKPSANDMPLYNAFRNKLQATNSTTGVKFIEIEMSEIPKYFTRGVNATIVYPSRESNAVIKFMNLVHQNNAKVGSGTISIFGTKEWTSMNTVKNYYKNTYNFHFSMANDLDYSKPETQRITSKFRRKYNTDFTKVMAQGFDVAYYFMSTLFLDKEPEQLIMNDFNVKRISNNDGFENVSTYIYKQSDFDYILLDKIK